MSQYHHGSLKQTLMQLALERIMEVGVEGVSMRQLAKDAGVSHAAPMRHFKSKEDLLSALMATFHQQLAERLSARVAEEAPRDGQATLRVMASAAMEWAREHPAEFSVIINPDVSRHTSEQTRQSLSDLMNLIAEAIIGSSPDSSIDRRALDTTVVYVVGAVLGVGFLGANPLMHQVYPDSDVDLDAIADHISAAVSLMPSQPAD